MTGRSPTTSGRSRRSGMVLWIVVVVTALVSLSALGFMVSMRTENLAAHLNADQMRLDQIAQSGAEYLSALAAMPANHLADLCAAGDHPDLFRDVSVDFDSAMGRHGRFSVLRSNYVEAANVPAFSFGVENESSKLNLPQLLAWDRRYPGHARRALLNLPGMTEEVADAILDWIDEDYEPREFGAESEFYLGLDPSRQPLNRVPTHIEELLAVRGVIAEQLIGGREYWPTTDMSPEHSTPKTVTDVARGRIGPAKDAQVIEGPPWTQFLTVYSAERNESGDGRPRIDLNQPELPALHRELSGVFDSETANFVVALRQFGPSSIAPSSASAEPVPTAVTSAASKYDFASPLDLIDAVVELPASTSPKSRERAAYRSPFVSDAGGSSQQLIRFLDRTTTDENPRLEGRVNVRTAPRPVLLAIPGLEPEHVDHIVTAQRHSEGDPANWIHAVAMLTNKMIDLDTMKRIEPFVTVGGNVWRAQILAYDDPPSPSLRCEVVVDGTRGDGVTIQYQELRHPDTLLRGLMEETAELQTADRKQL